MTRGTVCIWYENIITTKEIKSKRKIINVSLIANDNEIFMLFYVCVVVVIIVIIIFMFLVNKTNNEEDKYCMHQPTPDISFV